MPSCILKVSRVPSSLHDQVRNDRIEAVLRRVLIVKHKVLNTAIIGIETEFWHDGEKFTSAEVKCTWIC
jgi:hypothetical protein